MKNGRFGLYFRRLRSFLGLDLRFRLQPRSTAEELAKGGRVAEAGPGDQAREDVREVESDFAMGLQSMTAIQYNIW